MSTKLYLIWNLKFIELISINNLMFSLNFSFAYNYVIMSRKFGEDRADKS